jgi:glutamate/aspartate transport system substrate-binding protein
MKKQAMALAIAAFATSGAFAQANDTLAKIKASGAITEACVNPRACRTRWATASTPAFHYDVCANIIKDLEKAPARSSKSSSSPSPRRTAFPRAERHRGHRVRLDHQQCHPPEGRGFRRDHLRRRNQDPRQGQLGHQLAGRPEGQNIATTTGTTPLQTLRKQKRAENLSFKEVYGKDHSDSFLLLETGSCRRLRDGRSMLAALAAKSKSPKDYKILPDVLAVEPIGIMIRKDDPAFKKAVDESIKAQAKSGELTKLYDKWFLKPIPPRA